MTPSTTLPSSREASAQDASGLRTPRGPCTIFVDSPSVNARRILGGLPSVRFVDRPSDADLIWVRRGFTTLLPHVREDQLLNHFVQEGAMINKGRLAGHLAEAHDAGHDVDFYPETYRLFHAEERKRFLEQLPEADDPENPWIFKPSGLSRGRGVQILWQLDGLKRQLLAAGPIDGPVLDERLDYVAQRYIKRPLLLDGRKSEVRVYFLVASADPLLVLMYREGTVRLNNQAYRLDDFDNPLVHVTNTYQQYRHPEFDRTKQLKWRFADLDRHLADTRGQVAYTETKLKPAARAALARVACSVREELARTETRGLCFGLFGADLIIDDGLRPLLTEVQKNPGLSHVNDPVKIHVVPPMLQGAVEIALEVRARKRAGKPLAALETLYGFEWVVNDA